MKNSGSSYREQSKNSYYHSSRKSNRIIKKVDSSTFTPALRKKGNGGGYHETKKKQIEFSEFHTEMPEPIQEIYIFRESNTSKKKPARYIHIPITSHDVKII